MGSLLAALRNSADAMWVLQQSTRVIQNNVANASTPGFAKQRELILAKAFDLTSGLSGGVRWGGSIDSRNQYAEHAVRDQTSRWGAARKQADALAQIEGALPIGQDAGIAGAMNNLFQAFSALTVSPNDMAVRQTALNRAKDLAYQFNLAANQLSTSKRAIFQDISRTVDQINSLGRHLQDINTQIRKDARSQADSGLQADLHRTLEQLSQLTNATVLSQDDGTVSVYIGGQDLFIQGDGFYPLQVAQTPAGNAQILGLNGADITSTITAGELGGLMDLHENVLPAFEASLNQLATSFADTVNNTLAGGLDANGNAPLTPLFSYDPLQGEARTLSVNALQPRDLALASVAAPGGNGNALALADLANAKPLNGFTFAAFYGTVASQVGSAVEHSEDQANVQQGLLTQAQSLRDEFSRVNLDEEAVTLVEFQRSYQAVGQLIKALDDMTQTVIGLLR
ncbi:MAG: flagellar hook-associated protein FlgK [Bryobacterales bacterium]|nr:flagellar hook-associated protein FlgK [Bryobacterales bacterium]